MGRLKLNELFDLGLFEEMQGAGMIRVQTHPEFPELSIANYTELAQFSRTWNDVTRICRGLIYNAATLEILARPFPKIHNWNEPEAPRITKGATLYHWGDKEDGSLGILYVRPDARYAVATRGSFTSEQALHATELVDAGLVSFNETLIDAGYTALFEIVYPENRIVLDYGGRDELIPLGYIRNETGAYLPPTPAPFRTFDDIQQDLNRDNAEGWVVWLDPDTAVKIKQADYVELHRIVTGLNKKTVWRALQGGTFDALVESLPDELYAWATDVGLELSTRYWNAHDSATKWYDACNVGNPNQKDFALRVQERVPKWLQGLVFSLRAGKPVDTAIWKMVEPRGGDK